MSSYIKTIIIILLLIIIIYPHSLDTNLNVFNNTYNNLSSKINYYEKTTDNHVAHTLDYTVKCKNVEKRYVENHYTYPMQSTYIDVLPVYINNTRNKILTFRPNFISIVYEDGTSNGMLKSDFYSYDEDIYHGIQVGSIDSISPNSYSIYKIPFDKIDLDKNPTFVLGITQYDRQGNYIDDDTIEIKLSGLEYIIV